MLIKRLYITPVTQVHELVSSNDYNALDLGTRDQRFIEKHDFVK